MEKRKKFFIPEAKDLNEAEEVLEAVVKHTGLVIPSPRIYSVDYKHNGKPMRVAVGEPAPADYKAVGPVVCILGKHPLFGACTLDRGVARGGPIYIGAGDIFSMEYFDDDQDITHS